MGNAEDGLGNASSLSRLYRLKLAQHKKNRCHSPLSDSRKRGGGEGAMVQGRSIGYSIDPPRQNISRNANGNLDRERRIAVASCRRYAAFFIAAIETREDQFFFLNSSREKKIATRIPNEFQGEISVVNPSWIESAVEWFRGGNIFAFPSLRIRGTTDNGRRRAKGECRSYEFLSSRAGYVRYDRRRRGRGHAPRINTRAARASAAWVSPRDERDTIASGAQRAAPLADGDGKTSSRPSRPRRTDASRRSPRLITRHA